MGSKTGALPNESRFREASQRLADAEIRVCDYRDLRNELRKGDFIYLDPPYSTRNRKSKGEYWPNSFSDEDVPKLVDFLDRANVVGAKFLLSFKEDDQLISSVTPYANLTEYTVTRNIAGFAEHRGDAKEILLKNY